LPARRGAGGIGSPSSVEGRAPAGEPKGPPFPRGYKRPGVLTKKIAGGPLDPGGGKKNPAFRVLWGAVGGTGQHGRVPGVRGGGRPDFTKGHHFGGGRWGFRGDVGQRGRVVGGAPFLGCGQPLKKPPGSGGRKKKKT